jgi:hypothetical protein
MKTILNAQDKAEILSRLQNLKPESKGLWGTMNPGQAMCHLNDELQFILGAKTGATKPTFFQHFIKNLLLLGMTIPKGKAKAHPGLAQEFKGTPPKEFEADKKALIENLEAIAAKPENSTWHPNPLFGKMSRKQHARMTYVHFDHHLNQFSV